MFKTINNESIAITDQNEIKVIKQRLLEKYALDESKFDPEDLLSIALFAEYHLELYLLGVS